MVLPGSLRSQPRFGYRSLAEESTHGAGWSGGGRIKTRREIACIQGVLVIVHNYVSLLRMYNALPAVEKLLKKVPCCLTTDAV
jgi:hypothetical protein